MLVGVHSLSQDDDMIHVWQVPLPNTVNNTQNWTIDVVVYIIELWGSSENCKMEPEKWKKIIYQIWHSLSYRTSIHFC